VRVSGKPVCFVAAIVACVLVGLIVPSAADPAGQITEVATGGVTAGFSANAGPDGITTGPDGNVWFTEDTGKSIGRITPSGAVSEFSSGITGSSLFDIAPGSDGNLWFTEFASPGIIGKITTAGAITEVATGGVTAGFTAGNVEGITAGPDGNLWFTEPFHPAVARITPSGTVTEFTTGLTADPRFIVTGPDGNLWFTEEGNPGIIGKITTAGAITEVATGGVTAGFTANSDPRHIAVGADGNLWFTEVGGQRLARITTSGVVTEFSAGLSAGVSLEDINGGCDGNLWFTSTAEGSLPEIGRITTAGVITEFSAGLSPGASPYRIVAGPNQNMWFTEVNDPGRIATIGACGAPVPPPTPPSAPAAVVITPAFTG
jgi:streptogramin lyase